MDTVMGYRGDEQSGLHCCLVCTTAVVLESVDEVESVDQSRFFQYLQHFCDLVGLNDDERARIFKQFGVKDVRFCSKCCHNLESFRHIKHQLEVLTDQLSLIEKTLSQDLRLTKGKDDPLMALRGCLRSEYELRRCSELFGPMSPSHSPEKLKFPDELTDNKDDVLINTSAVKPCHIKLERVDALETVQTPSDISIPTQRQKRLELKTRRKQCLGREVQTTCGTCRFTFESRSSYETHLDQESGECNRIPHHRHPLPPNCSFDKTRPKNLRYMCGECGKQVRSSDVLRRHFKARHADGFVLMCEFCPKTFNSKGTLERHKRVAHLEQVLATEGNSEEVLDKLKSQTCEICQAKFTTVTANRNHMVRAHSKDFEFYCEICGIGKVNRAELKEHVATTHAVEKLYQCVQCDEKFAYRNALKRHRIAKHGDKSDYKFKCDQCPKAFYVMYKLTRHVIQAHRKNDPTLQLFKCDLCNYSAIDKNYLHTHTKTKKHRQNIANLGNI